MPQRAIHGDFIYFVTANVKNRRWFFDTPLQAERLGQVIQTSCQLKQFDLLAYCILPNHMHLLVRKVPRSEITSQRTRGRVRCEGGDGAPETVNHALDGGVGTFERVFLFRHRRRPRRRSQDDGASPTLSMLLHTIKSTFSHALKQGAFWQHRSHFRIIEDEEYLANVVEYIRSNYQKMDLPGWYGQVPFVFIDQAALDRVFEP